MERLTKKYKDGHIGINCDENSCMEEGSCPEVKGCKFLKQVLSKLSAYENTDLVPEQFVELDKMYLEKCEEVNQLNAKLEKAEPYIKLAEKMNLCDLVAENQRLANELIFVNAELRECKESLKRVESEQNELPTMEKELQEKTRFQSTVGSRGVDMKEVTIYCDK